MALRYLNKNKKLTLILAELLLSNLFADKRMLYIRKSVIFGPSKVPYMNKLPSRKIFVIFTLSLSINLAVKAQSIDTSKISTTILDSVRVQAYGGKNLQNTAAAVNIINSQQLNRFANLNILAAVNATPGVRMEERSLGSYRFNIRGSSVRSPYGVRNVKLYYEEIPFTAPGGNSMLNMLGFYNIGSLEIIKGPGSSRYGAGTGGVVLMNAPTNSESIAINAGLIGGSYGVLGANASVDYKGQRVAFEHQQADGYRDHTAMKRQVFSYNGRLMRSNANELKAYFIFSDLNYQTPGALTLAEYKLNSKASRPSVGPNPSAVQANASIHQKAALLGLHNRYVFSESFANITTLYGFYNETTNPAIQNFEDKKEPHLGARTVFNYKLNAFNIDLGGEFQHGDFKYTTYKNLSGNRGDLRTADQVKINQLMGFAQVDWQYQRLLLTAGASINRVTFNFKRSNTIPAIDADKTYAAEIQPRFAAIYQLNKNLSIYMNVVKGFSPPASSEIFADNSSYNLALQPETGWSFEPGFRGKLWNGGTVDMSFFTTRLLKSIVTRRDAAGANYYLNAGKIQQRGVETVLTHHFFNSTKPISVLLRASHAWHQFNYAEFVQLNQNFTGNQLPGVAPHSFSLMADLKHASGVFTYLSFTQNDKIPLNDANTEFANDYQLLSLKVGGEKRIKNTNYQVCVGVDNLLNQTYSLGNDINGFGGRYYNVAPARNFYVGLKVGL